MRLLVVLTDSDHQANRYGDGYARADVNMAFSEAKAKGVKKPILFKVPIKVLPYIGSL